MPRTRALWGVRQLSHWVARWLGKMAGVRQPGHAFGGQRSSGGGGGGRREEGPIALLNCGIAHPLSIASSAAALQPLVW